MNMMDFDRVLETWLAKNTGPPYDVNRDALRQALQTEEARGPRGAAHPASGTLSLRDHRNRHGGLCRILIAISITNGWSAIYAIAAGGSFCIPALWHSREDVSGQAGFGSSDCPRKCATLKQISGERKRS
jgi:hypothetical protein